MAQKEEYVYMSCICTGYEEVWQQLITKPKLRKKYGFIPFTEELLSWLKRIAVIFGVIVILFIVAIIIFR